MSRYLYSQKATFVDVKQALHTRTAAEKYMELELVEACHRFIRKSMLPTDVCDVLEYGAKNGNLANFDDPINKLLKMRGVQVLESKGFIAASMEIVLSILKSPRLCVKEYDMAKAVKVAAPKRGDLRFFTEGRHTDVEFLVEHGSDPPKSFKAHKMVLAMRNEVFETMFYGNLPEKDQVLVTDLHPDGFSAFLK
ncbi:hypothetical protein IscW_ISCW021617 [Ixodes scapularis]|uniref:BTB domain-containing protein n=1 Tax=Ixodes scapularis TaxID=6945 RepID=B7Q7Y0_IXOSC|nr:hypothetical protein IscW_ISCW021617 [Ixodes scapularis]|eukprot:XP_002412237.1 hypothetical protein IscW_ISCW021617 [Ixodes scapularis]